MTTYPSVCAYLSALRTWARCNGRPDPAIDPNTDLPHIKYIHFCRGAKRRLGGKAMTRTPLSLKSLRNMVRNLRLGGIVPGPVAQDMIAALCLAFWALLRVSEYTVPGNSTWFDLTTHATRGDVRFVPSITAPNYMVFTVKVSKQDQYKVGHDLIVYPSADPTLCALTALKAVILADPQPPTAPLFDFATRPANSPSRARSMSRPLYISLFNKTVHSVGLDTSTTKTHSLRSGGATAMLHAGIPTYVISRLGRWQSSCWQTYTWASHALVKHAHSVLGTKIPDSTPVDFDAVRRDL